MQTKTPRLEGEELELWRGFIRLSQLLPAVLEADLAERGESLSRYEILAVLASVGALRLMDIGKYALVSKPRLSVHVASLEKDGFVARTPDPDDGRASQVTLTSAGRKHLAKLTPGHLAIARAAVVERIDAADRPRVLKAIASVLEALGDTWRPER
jgi:DNA-binding MarR family transcriptional regulator